MKRVSFNVAKAIKEAGYPQGWECDEHYCLESEGEYGYQIGDLVSVNTIHKNCLEVVSAPTYMEVWIWLWREKKICINCNYDKYNLPPMWWCNNEDRINYNSPNFDGPEEAIIGAIEYLVDKNLIK